MLSFHKFGHFYNFLKVCIFYIIFKYSVNKKYYHVQMCSMNRNNEIQLYTIQKIIEKINYVQLFNT